jgi:hypothetical protein
MAAIGTKYALSKIPRSGPSSVGKLTIKQSALV